MLSHLNLVGLFVFQLVALGLDVDVRILLLWLALVSWLTSSRIDLVGVVEVGIGLNRRDYRLNIPAISIILIYWRDTGGIREERWLRP